MMIIFVACDGVCQKYACGAMPPPPTTDAPTYCIHTDAAKDPATTNVGICASGKNCAVAGVFTTASLADALCMPSTGPTPKTNIVPGDVCNTGDSCNQGTCTKGACASNNKVDSACNTHADCPIATWCKAQKCAAIIAPGAACTPEASVTTASP